jgi:hypothetical protein
MLALLAGDPPAGSPCSAHPYDKLLVAAGSGLAGCERVSTDTAVLARHVELSTACVVAHAAYKLLSACIGPWWALVPACAALAGRAAVSSSH